MSDICFIDEIEHFLAVKITKREFLGGNVKLKKRLLVSVLGTGLLLSSLPNSVAFANQNLDQEISAKKQELSSLQAKEKEINDLLGTLEAKVNETNQKIAGAEKDIAKTKEEAKQLETKIAEVKERLEKRKEVLQNRARAVQQNGGSSNYLDMIVEAESFGDLVDRTMAMSKILDADKMIIEEQKKDQQTLEASEAELQKKLAQVESDLTEIEALKEQLTYQMNDKNSLLAAMKEQKNEANKELKDLEIQKAAILAEAQQAKEEAAASGNATAESSSGNGTAAASGNTAAAQTTNTSGGKAVKSSKPSAPSTPTFKKGSSAIETAINAGSSLIGRSSYKFGGGRSPSDIANGLFDCSSFIHWSFKSAGVSVGSSTGALASQGRAVSPSEMKRGDLVFFDTYKKNGHVGIYLGNGTFLNCNSTDGAAIDSMGSSYWSGVFKGHVRRVVE